MLEFAVPISRRLFVGLPIASAVWLAVAVLTAGALRPGYDHAAQYMSELGARGTSGAWAMNWLGFVPAEMLMLGFLALAARVLQRHKWALAGLAVLALYAIGLLVGALAPCDAGCRPADPTPTHTLHMLAGGIAYFSALAGITLLALAVGQLGARNLRIAGLACAAAGAVLLTNLNPEFAGVGLVQRGLEALIYGWLIGFGVWLARFSPPKR